MLDIFDPPAPYIPLKTLWPYGLNNNPKKISNRHYDDC